MSALATLAAEAAMALPIAAALLVCLNWARNPYPRRRKKRRKHHE